MNTVYIGFDAREWHAWQVAALSLQRHASSAVRIQPLVKAQLQDQGLYYRPEHRDATGRLVDDISGAPMSTDFALTRFLVPTLAPSGWSLFADCDFLFRGDINKLFALADPQYAVMVVKHGDEAAGRNGMKMDGQVQQPYARKNWSSLILWNGSHRANKELTPAVVNRMPGLWLHQFGWLEDRHIGELPLEWNWLEGISEDLAEPKGVHYTRGIPSMPGYEGSACSDEWHAHLNDTDRHIKVAA
jgi:hypothetical protein